jgi:hypothetical protein
MRETECEDMLIRILINMSGKLSLFVNSSTFQGLEPFICVDPTWIITHCQCGLFASYQ